MKIPEDCLLPLRECFGIKGRPIYEWELENLVLAGFLNRGFLRSRLSKLGERALAQLRLADEEAYRQTLPKKHTVPKRKSLARRPTPK